jgi:hypothetical protein
MLLEQAVSPVAPARTIDICHYRFCWYMHIKKRAGKNAGPKNQPIVTHILIESFGYQLWFFLNFARISNPDFEPG